MGDSKLVALIKKIILGLAVYGLFSSSANAASITLNPIKNTVDIDDTFSIVIGGSGFNTTGLAGGTFDLAYNDDIFEITSVSIDPYWDFFPDPGAKNGDDLWSGIAFDAFANDPATGDFTIATINMVALSGGSSLLTLENTFFSDGFDILNPDLGMASILVSGPALKPVPLPGAVWLMWSGLGFIGVAVRKRN